MSEQAQTNFITDRQLAILQATRDIVCAAVSTPGAHDVVALIGNVHQKLTSIIDTGPDLPLSAVEHVTPVDARRSITPNGLVSFIDGKTYQTLRRHLGTHGLTPESYRTRFGLPSDYPMTAPAYSEKRSALAKASGLGQLRTAPTDPMQAAA